MRLPRWGIEMRSMVGIDRFKCQADGNSKQNDGAASKLRVASLDDCCVGSWKGSCAAVFEEKMRCWSSPPVSSLSRLSLLGCGGFGIAWPSTSGLVVSKPKSVPPSPLFQPPVSLVGFHVTRSGWSCQLPQCQMPGSIESLAERPRAVVE